MKLKSDWAIKCSNEQMVAYRATIKALGYPIFLGFDRATSMEGCTHIARYYNNSSVIRESDTDSKLRQHQFENIEEFLQWHFAPELNAEQQQILELEATIKQAQAQIEQLKQQHNR